MSDGDRTYLRCLEHYRTENEKKKNEAQLIFVSYLFYLLLFVYYLSK